MTPARLYGTEARPDGELPDRWQHPFTGEWMEDGIDELLEKATRRSAAYMMAAQGYWAGKLSLAKVMGLLGSASYLSGIPDEESAPRQLDRMPETEPLEC